MIRSVRLLAPLVVLSFLLALPAAAAPFSYPAPVSEAFPETGPPSVTAPSWILYDDSTEMVLASWAADEPRSIASTTKIMTGLLVLENAALDEVVTVSEEAANTGGQEIGLVAGEKFTVGALFKALMVRSANDAATALAEHVAGSVPAFVDMMNSRAQELGLENTSFANPHGMDAAGHYSSARDLLTLARLAMERPEFGEVVKARAMVLPDDPEGNARVGISTNLMLTSYDGMLGVKTGLTPQALFTFVGAAERDGRRLFAVVLGSPENFGHFADARALLDYGFKDLGFYGDAFTKTEYEASMARVEPDHLVTMSQIETYLHLAGQGLMLEHPAPLVDLPQPEAPPIVEISRGPQGADTSIGDAVLYWVQRVFAE